MSFYATRLLPYVTVLTVNWYHVGVGSPKKFNTLRREQRRIEKHFSTVQDSALRPLRSGDERRREPQSSFLHCIVFAILCLLLVRHLPNLIVALQDEDVL
jgi:hypothetical protein